MAYTLLPDPIDMGAPDHFTEWRHHQDKAIIDMAEAKTRFVMSVLPTGSGKSLIYMMLSRLVGSRTAVLTRTKALQRQLDEEFSAMGAVQIKGMGSYKCKALGTQGELFEAFGDRASLRSGHPSCEDGPCHAGVTCSLKSDGCDYYDQVRAAGRAEVVITNYTYWMTQHRYGKGLGQFDLLILDEAHDAPAAVSDFLAVSLDLWQLNKIGAEPLAGSPEMAQWAEWAAHHYQTAAAKAEHLKDHITEMRQRGQKVTTAQLAEAKTIKQLAGTLDVVRKVDDGWICHQTDRGRYVYTPVWPAPYTEEALFRQIPKVVLTSATVRPKSAYYLGIKDTDLTIKEYPSVFPKQRRPIYHIKHTPRLTVTRKMTPGQKQLWLADMDYIMATRSDRKGIIHTVSYERARWIHQSSDHTDRMIVHSREGTDAAIARFKAADPETGCVLVSPSVTTGYDFPYDQCEYIIIAKVPFPDSSDPVLKAREIRDEEYQMYSVMQTLIQSTGRGMRAADDMCECFVVDDMVGWFVWKYKHLAPKWFLDTLQTRERLPVAPPRLQRSY